MKRFSCVFLTIVLLLAMCSCSSEDSGATLSFLADIDNYKVATENETFRYDNFVFTYPDGCRYYNIGEEGDDICQIYINSDKLSVTMQTTEEDYSKNSTEYIELFADSLEDALVENYIEEGFYLYNYVDTAIGGIATNIPTMAKEENEVLTLLYPVVISTSGCIYIFTVEVIDAENIDYLPLFEFVFSSKYSEE